jgi:hypothetical protein
MFIIHRRDLSRDGRQPVRLGGYGGFTAPSSMLVSALNDQLAPPYDPLKMVARLEAEASQGGVTSCCRYGPRDTAAAPRCRRSSNRTSTHRL